MRLIKISKSHMFMIFVKKKSQTISSSSNSKMNALHWPTTVKLI